MKIIAFLLCGVLSPALCAHTGGVVDLKCPLDGTEFKSWQDFSGTSYGLRLDLKREGLIAQPWALAQCPKCHFPLFKTNLSEDEKSELRTIVAGNRFIRAAKSRNPYFALAVLQEELQAPPKKIAESYLYASWLAEENNPGSYRAFAKRAIEWFDLAAGRPAEADDAKNSRQISIYLPIELSRRVGEFDEAKQRINDAADLNKTKIKWLPGALADEKRLVAAKDASPHDMGKPGDASK